MLRLLESNDYLSLEVADLECIAASQPRSLLSEYIFAKEALDIVNKNLPILVELYEYIHRELSYRITKDLANELTVRRMFEQLKKSKLQTYFSPEDIKHLRKMIEVYFSKILN